MSFTVKNPTIKKSLERLQKPPIQQALNAIKDDNISRTTQRGWTRFKTGIETKVDTDHSGRVFVNDKEKQIGAWLQYGRGEVFPKRASVLRWVTKSGEVVFAKHAKATKPINWWGLFETGKKKVREIIDKWLKNSGK